MTAAQILPAGPGDWAAVKQVRLAALQDTPSAFASSYAAEAGRDEAGWRQWTQRACVVLARHGGEAVGIAAGISDDEWPGDRHLVSMWVAPPWRGTTVAADLAEAVCSWACDAGAGGVVLWVVDGNARARAFYERLGFATTGRRGRLSRDPSVEEECFRRACHRRPSPA